MYFYFLFFLCWQRLAKIFRPKLNVGGASAYARDWDFPRMRAIADSVQAYLLVDMVGLSDISHAILLICFLVVGARKWLGCGWRTLVAFLAR